MEDGLGRMETVTSIVNTLCSMAEMYVTGSRGAIVITVGDLRAHVQRMETGVVPVPGTGGYVCGTRSVKASR